MLDPGNPACLILRTRKTNFSRCFTANYRYHFAISILITLRQLSPHDILLNTTDVKDLGWARHQPSSTIINHHQPSSTIINRRSQGTTFAVKSQGMSFSVLVWMPSSTRELCGISQLGPGGLGIIIPTDELIFFRGVCHQPGYIRDFLNVSQSIFYWEIWEEEPEKARHHSWGLSWARNQEPLKMPRTIFAGTNLPSSDLCYDFGFDLGVHMRRLRDSFSHSVPWQGGLLGTFEDF